jgi:hypothetical protein
MLNLRVSEVSYNRPGVAARASRHAPLVSESDRAFCYGVCSSSLPV